MNRVRKKILALVLVSSFLLAGCESKPQQSSTAGKSSSAMPASPSNGQSEKPDDHAGHDHAEGGHDHAEGGQKDHAAGHGGDVVDLGTSTIGEFSVRASRDKGEIKPGGDAPVDAWVTAAEGKPATVSAVRFWIGTEDAKGSVKAKADIEDAKQPNHWHTHVEIPKPLPDGSKLWVEIEAGAGKKAAVAFDLKP